MLVAHAPLESTPWLAVLANRAQEIQFLVTQPAVVSLVALVTKQLVTLALSAQKISILLTMVLVDLALLVLSPTELATLPVNPALVDMSIPLPLVPHLRFPANCAVLVSSRTVDRFVKIVLLVRFQVLVPARVPLAMLVLVVTSTTLFVCLVLVELSPRVVVCALAARMAPFLWVRLLFALFAVVAPSRMPLALLVSPVVLVLSLMVRLALLVLPIVMLLMVLASVSLVLLVVKSMPL